MAFRRNMINVWTKVQTNKEQQYKDKAAETRAHSARLVDMQRYVDMHPLKRKALIAVLKSKATDCDLKVYEKGALVFTRLLDVADVLKENKANRHIRGGQATKYKYLELKKAKD